MTEPAAAGAGRPGAPGLICPACRVDLVMSERAGVEIDYCPRCRGVWLDRGELDKILERTAAEFAAAPSPESARHDPPRQQYRPPYEQRDQRHHEHRPYDHRHHKRKKSFLDDLFDFD